MQASKIGWIIVRGLTADSIIIDEESPLFIDERHSDIPNIKPSTRLKIKIRFFIQLEIHQSQFLYTEKLNILNKKHYILVSILLFCLNKKKGPERKNYS